jgi:hypothetical protein
LTVFIFPCAHERVIFHTPIITRKKQKRQRQDKNNLFHLSLLDSSIPALLSPVNPFISARVSAMSVLYNKTMAYTKTNWQARQGGNLNRFTKSQETGTSVVLTPNPESVTVPGTPFTAENMNHIETGIGAAHEAIAAEETARKNAITAEETARKNAITAEAQTRETADRNLQAAIDLLVPENLSDLPNLLASKAPVASPTFTGTPTATTPPAGNNSTRLATTGFFQAEKAGLARTGNYQGAAANVFNAANASSPRSGIYDLYEGSAIGLDKNIWYHLIHLRHANDNGYNSQIAVQFGTQTLLVRSHNGQNWSAWIKVNDASVLGPSNINMNFTVGVTLAVEMAGYDRHYGIGASVVIKPSSCASNPTYQIDGIHPSDPVPGSWRFCGYVNSAHSYGLARRVA